MQITSRAIDPGLSVVNCTSSCVTPSNRLMRAPVPVFESWTRPALLSVSKSPTNTSVMRTNVPLGVGEYDGDVDGDGIGATVGVFVGAVVGVLVGARDGVFVGSADGTLDGAAVGK